MYTLAKTKENKRNIVFGIALIALLTAVTYLVFPQAFADVNGTAKNVIDAVVSIVRLIVNVLGAIFALVGIVKFAIAHANEDGPAQQKAAMMIATGIVLLLMGTVIIKTLNISSWIDTNVTG